MGLPLPIPDVVWPRRAALLAATLAGLWLATGGAATAQDRWAADDVTARAVLPAPSGNGTVTGATMLCSEQRFSLLLALDGATAAEEAATLSVDRRDFATMAAPDEQGLNVAVPAEAIEPLKLGRLMRLAVAGELGERLGAQEFSLAGSRVALTAMEEICSRPDMSAYQAVTFTPYSSYGGLARELRDADIVAFRRSTASEPVLTVAMVEMGERRRVLFTRLCGSSWYYGVSGCNVTGFSTDQFGDWRAVYDSEGVQLHLDWSHLSEGRPNLVTLPLRGRGDPIHWRWDGRRYGILTN